jgi:hypothetical protein
MGLLTLLFAARVAGQAVQRWLPQPLLPPFAAFQGSGLPYWALLGAQLLILWLMVATAVRAHRATLVANPRTGRALAWIGWLYMTGSLLRIAVGVLVPVAPGWFKAWIPGFFHLVLAGFVLVLAAYHRTGRRPSFHERA